MTTTPPQGKRVRKIVQKGGGVYFSVSEVRLGNTKLVATTSRSPRDSATPTTMKTAPQKSKLTTYSQVNVHLEPVITIRPSENDDQFYENLTRIRGENGQKYRSFSRKLREKFDKNLRFWGKTTSNHFFAQNDQNLAAKRAEIFDDFLLRSRYNQREISLTKLKPKKLHSRQVDVKMPTTSKFSKQDD